MSVYTKATSYLLLESEVNFQKAIESFGILCFQKVSRHVLKGKDVTHAPAPHYHSQHSQHKLLGD